ncbi:MAG: Uma2 family endonuclease [Deltaproteobacteria bacterium]|nr:Uma2 family endonuclease [Deltaproteobacteria bacterium]
MTANPDVRYTPEEYLKMERDAACKSEYFNGEIFAMTGASRKHNLIAGSVYSSIYTQLRKRECEAYANDMRVKVPSTGLYTYPDIVVVCSPPLFDDVLSDTLLNPDVIVEVLSQSTEAYDRGDKFQNYRALPSLSEYILVHQDTRHVEHYARQPDSSWRFLEYFKPEDGFQIRSIGCALKLEEIYEKVDMFAC